MFFSIQKFLSQPPKTLKKHQKHSKNEEEDSKISPCSSCFGHGEHTAPSASISTARSSRSNFAKSASSSLFSNTDFTNHESIPSLLDSFSSFSETFPLYRETLRADFIRENEYRHLDDHVCLDYSGVNLFSRAQMNQSSIFTISYKSASIKSELQYGENDRGFEFGVRSRIMNFLKVSGDDYGSICTANRTAAFRLLAETYPFESNKKLVIVYDYESEAVSAMSESAAKRGAKIMSASFSWPGMRIHTAKMKRILRNGKNRGLFVFPHMSRVSGVRYPYLWVKLARDNGWHVILDACTLGPKDMNTLGIALIQPDFIICSFFKVFGENPAGFATLFIKKSSREVLQSSVLARSIGMVSIVPAGNLPDLDTTSSFSGPILPVEKCEEDEAEKTEEEEEEEEEVSAEIVEEIEKKEEIEFHGLDHADSLGLLLIHNRLRCITNWLVIALMKLHHPHSENGNSLVKIYGPRVKFDRGPALAFNVFDWKGEKIEPLLVQKLADRSNISLSCGFLQKIVFLEKYEVVKEAVLEERVCEKMADFGCRKKEIEKVGIAVVSASFGYLANFEDAYRLWAFVAKFLDADFVEKERWRYVALNQKMIEL